MNRLLIPVYVFSLIKRDKFSRVKVRLMYKTAFGINYKIIFIKDPRTMLDQSSALFLLAEVSDRLINKL
jgi:hypothetical protein